MNGVMFGTKHSFRDFGLFLKSRPVIDPPETKTYLVDLPGADGSLDLSDALTGRIHYEKRKIKMVFVVIDGRNRWASVYSDIMDYLHGQTMRIIFDDDIGYFYEGRIAVDSWESEKKHSTLTIEAVVDPYKREVACSDEPWRWDDLNLENGVIREYDEMTITGSKTMQIIGTRMPVAPVFTSTVAMTAVMGGKTYSISAGTDYARSTETGSVDVLTIVDGVNSLTINGTGTLTIAYRGGRL